jgi:hypothetical protein
MTVGRVALRAAAALGLGFIRLPLFLVSWLSFFRDEVVVTVEGRATVRGGRGAGGATSSSARSRAA